MTNKIALCAISLLVGMLLGIAIKKTATPLFSWGNEEVELKMDEYK